jgi:hypothetical protein
MGTYRQPSQQANFFNPAQDVLVGIESVEKDVTGRLKTVRDFENAAAVRRADMLKALADTEGMDDMGAVDSLQASLMEQVDDLYKLDIASFEGDRSEYLRKQNETNNIVSNIPALMGLIDAEGEKFKEAENSGTDFIKKILKTNNQDYVDFVQNASRGGDKVSFRIQNGNIIAQLNGKDVFNGTAYVKAKKEGVDLVNYAGDYSKEIGEADKQAYQNLDNLVKVQSIQKEINKGRTLNTQQIKDYTEAKAEYTKRLEEGVLVDALLNESTYQTFTNYGTGKDSDSLDAWKNDEMQRGATKQAIIDYMVEQRFPRSGKYVTSEKEQESQTKTQKDNIALQKEKLELEKTKEANDKEIKKMKLDFEQGKIEAFEEGLKNFVDRNIYHARRAFELPEGEERNEQIVKLLNEATKGAVGDFRIKDGNIIDIDGNEISVVRTKFGLLEYLNKVTVLDDFTGEAANKAKTYVGRRNKELGYPTQKEFEAAYAALQVGQSTMGPDGKYYTKTK